MIDANAAAVILAPYESGIGVTGSITAGAASAAITLGELADSDGYITIALDVGTGVSPVGAYLTAKHDADPADPDPTATSGAGRTMWFDAADLRNIRFRPGDRIKVWPGGGATVLLRQYRSSV